MHIEQAKGGTSYMSASDPRIHFGLGKRTKIDSLQITWPSGQVDKLTNVPVDTIIAVKEGVGIVPHPFRRCRDELVQQAAFVPVSLPSASVLIIDGSL